MKYFIYALFSLSLLSLGALPAQATDAKNGYMIMGPGSYTCQRIVSDLAEDAKRKNPASVIVYSNWLAGDLTAYNRDTKGTYSILGGTSFPEAFAWAVQYCQDNPDKIYASAADALIAKLKPHRLNAMPQPKDEQEFEEKGKDTDDEDEDDDKAEGSQK